MTRVRVLREAVEELRAIAQYYEAQRLGLGRAFAEEVRRAQLRIQERPLASRIERSEVRVRTLHDFRIESTTEPARTKYSSSLLRIVDDDRDSGVRASSHITTGWSERDKDKVLFQIGRQRVAQAERYAAQRSFRA
jgi:hypothetical protein